MPPTLAGRLDERRARTFVGREAELEVFAALLARADDPAVVVVHGPAGVGKSALLVEFGRRAEAAGAECVRIDARDLPPTAEALEFRLSGLLDAEPARRPVVLIDTYELLADVDVVLREQLAPRFPAETVLVMAGQHPPATGWRLDAGWSALLQPMPLRNLTRHESSTYLTLRGVPDEVQADAFALTHGHPMALALVGQIVRQKGVLAEADSADVIRALLDRLLPSVPGRAHREALEAAAHVRTVNEALLGTLLDTDDPGALFDWLRALPFVEAGATGLHLHDLVREGLVADLRWRHPERSATVHDRARQFYLDRMGVGDPAVQVGLMLDLIYLHPRLRVFLQPPTDDAPLFLDAARSEDAAGLVAAVRRHEGERSAHWAAHWLDQHLTAWRVVRGRDGVAQGAVCLLPLEQLGEVADPAVRAARVELAGHPPLRPGETNTLIRFWFATADHQAVSAVQSLIATQFARHFLTTPGLAVTLMSFAHPHEWEAFCAYADQRRAPAADFDVDGLRFASFVHDWRIATAAAWVARLSLQELGADETAAPAIHARTLVLDEQEFATAARQAIKDYTRPDRLRHSALLGSRLVATRSAADGAAAERVDALKTVLKDAAETLAVAARDRRLHRVIVRAYLAPAPTLERAAEVLDMPYSTFRRLLGTALDRVVALLWQQELDS